MILGFLFAALAIIGIGYTLFAAVVVSRFARQAPVSGSPQPVTLLKPLHGAEPRLADNLASFLDQDWDAPIEMIVGVQREEDPARGALASLRGDDGRGGTRAVVEIVDSTTHGANAKIGNLINMIPRAHHDLLILSDSDMAVPRDYLATLAGALAQPGVGAVSCVYRGRGDAGPWSRLAAAQISYQFLPSVLVGLRLGLARPCMGSTIALRRQTLDRIGGFGRFADELADDYAIGAAVRDLGLTVAIPPMVLSHACAERSLGDVWRHELRWAATVFAIDRTGTFGSIVTHPIALALLASLFSPSTGLVLLGMAVVARLWLKRRIDALVGTASAPAWLLPLRDTLSFLVFLAAFCVRSVDWRGQRLTMASSGRIAATPE